MLSRYGIKEVTAVGSAAEEHVERVRINGYTVVADLIPAKVLEEARRRLDAVYAIQAEEVGGEDQLRAINDADVVRAPMVSDDFFLQFVLNSEIRSVLDVLLGDYYILQQQNGVINRPRGGHYQAAWHRDLPYQHFTTSRPIAISVLYCLDDFRNETGGTLVLGGSHRLERFPSDQFVEANQHSITASAGSAVLFDSLLFHRAGDNRSPGIRRGLNHVYSLPFFKQQINLTRALRGRYAEDPALRKILGYDSESGDDALEWRRRRLKNR